MNLVLIKDADGRTEGFIPVPAGMTFQEVVELVRNHQLEQVGYLEKVQWTMVLRNGEIFED